MIVADGYILHNYFLQVNESSLTGESGSVEKREGVLTEKTVLADRSNMVYSGSLVTYGRAEVLVVGTGMDTELGRIVGLINAAKERKTPLQESLDQFSQKLAALIVVISMVVFGLCLYWKMPMLDAMLYAMALAVAAIPEALGSIVTIVQAFGMQKVAKENGIIKNLKAVADAKRAGIRPVMITGDHKITAVAIAMQIGIYEDGDMALTGAELDEMSEEQLEEKIDKIAVYARVSPENKIRIVSAWQKKGHIVSMTGDGVNDAPALKKADIGVAMGITGTEVAKDAAEMILFDDNFATIIMAVSNGRNVFRNIKNAILFLLSGNTAGILSVLYTSILGLAVPFAPVHLLFINLLTDSLPALAIGMEPADDKLLDEMPRNPKTGIMTKDFAVRMLLQGGLIAGATICAYHIGLRDNAALASTMAFATLALARLFHGFNCRSKESIFTLGLTSNKYSIYAFFAGAVLLALVLAIPAFHGLFAVVDLSLKHVGQMVGLAFLPTVVIQMVKVIENGRKTKEKQGN